MQSNLNILQIFLTSDYSVWKAADVLWGKFWTKATNASRLKCASVFTKTWFSSRTTKKSVRDVNSKSFAHALPANGNVLKQGAKMQLISQQPATCRKNARLHEMKYSQLANQLSLWRARTCTRPPSHRRLLCVDLVASARTDSFWTRCWSNVCYLKNVRAITVERASPRARK